MSDIRSNHDPVLAAINMFQNHPSVVNIKQREFNSTFSFKNTNENEVPKIINRECSENLVASFVRTLTIARV